jgi:hypothetical protein
MSVEVVTCPDCGHTFCVNGRGRCRCGAYLVHHAASSFTLRDRTWFWRDGAWELYTKAAT